MCLLGGYHRFAKEFRSYKTKKPQTKPYKQLLQVFK